MQYIRSPEGAPSSSSVTRPQDWTCPIQSAQSASVGRTRSSTNLVQVSWQAHSSPRIQIERSRPSLAVQSSPKQVRRPGSRAKTPWQTGIRLPIPLILVAAAGIRLVKPAEAASTDKLRSTCGEARLPDIALLVGVLVDRLQ